MYLPNFFDYLSKEKNFSRNTVIAYRKDLETFKLFCLDHYEISNISKVSYPIIRDWIINLSEKNLSPLTINRKISSLNKYYDFLLKTQVNKVSPLKNHKRLKVQKKLIIPFSEDEVFKVIDVFSNDFEGKRNLLIVDTLYSTGIRRDELINIKLNDVFLSENLIKVLGKRNKERLVPVLGNLNKRIKDYLSLRKEVSLSSSYLFITNKGKSIGPSLVYRVVKKYFSKVSTKVKTSPHVLRHSFATHMLNNGADINSIKEIMGHSSLASTQIYTKIKLPKIINDYLKFRNEIKSSSSNFFITTKGKKIGPSLVYRVVKNYFSKVSTKVKTSPHVLRHSFATHMLNNGADINSIKEIMGHSSLASTQIYTKIKLPKIINDYKKNHPRERKK